MIRGPLFVLAALVLAGLLARDPWPPDETRYADVARAVLSGEGVVVPRLHGAVYGEKPPVFFWLTAALERAGLPLGVGPRAVSGLAALATLALLPAIGRGLGLPRELATRAAWILAASPLFFAYAHVGMLDATSTALVSAAIAAKLARGPGSASTPLRRAGLIVAEGLALGAALLTKGPVLLLFPASLRLGAALARPRSTASADAGDAAALALALCVAGAWLVAAAGDAGVDYVRAITIGQAVRRVAGDAPHLRPPGFLLAVTLAGLLPFVWLGLPLARIRARARALRGWRPSAAGAALAGWCLVPALALSLLRTQQPHYLLPALPAAALLLAGPIVAPERWALRASVGLATLIGVALVAAALLAPALVPDRELARTLAGDAVLRAGAALAGALLLALVFAPPLRGLAAWRRGVVGSVAVAALGTLAVAKLDPFMSPRALLADPAVAGATALDVPASLRSAVRVLGGPADVELLAEHQVPARLAKEPGRVALVWERDLPRLGDAAAGLETVARGYARGRAVVALRAARPPAAAVSLPPTSR